MLVKVQGLEGVVGLDAVPRGGLAEAGALLGFVGGVPAVTVSGGDKGVVHDDVDAQDPTSADILHSVLETLEKQRWMLASQLRHIAN